MWSFTVKKENGHLIFKDYGGFQHRNPSTIWCVTEADKIYNWPDFRELVVHTDDFEHDSNVLTYSKTNADYDTMIPDFTFHSWPETGVDDYDQVISEIQMAGSKEPTIDKVGWIGNLETHPIRKRLFEIGKQNSEIMDIQEMTWLQETNGARQMSTKYVSIPDLVANYSLLIDIEGRGWSARLKPLLWSNRPVILVDRPHHEYFYEHLKAWEHYIPVKRDLSDLVEKINWCKTNRDEAAKISQNALTFSKTHLTRHACFSKWNDIIQKQILKTI